MNKGISLVTLIITIVVIIILTGITYFSSLNTVDQAQVAKKKAEFNNVCTFVRQISSRAEAGLIDIDMTGAEKASDSQIVAMVSDSDESEFTSVEAQKVQSFNNSRKRCKVQLLFCYW